VHKLISLSNPFIVFGIFLIVSILNIILSVHFITILFVGVIFTSFIHSISFKYYWSLVFSILAFIFIEISNGLSIGSLSLVSFFIYTFIVPKIGNYLKSKIVYLGILNLIFYSGVFLLFSINSEINNILVSKIILNFILDLFLVSLL